MPSSKPRKTKAPPSSDPNLVPLAKATQISGMARSTLYRLMKAKRIKAYRNRNRVLVDMNSLIDYQAAVVEWSA